MALIGLFFLVSGRYWNVGCGSRDNNRIGLGQGVPSLFGFQKLSFDELKDIAETTGGLFFAARSDSDLEEVYERINEMETSEREDPRYRTVDRFEWPLGIGLLLMFLAVLFDALIVRRVP